jgi:hypothetical protein
LYVVSGRSITAQNSLSLATPKKKIVSLHLGGESDQPARTAQLRRIASVRGTGQAMSVDFFKELYSADPAVDPTELVDLVERKISDEMNEVLCKPFSVEEISDALFQMCPLKAPGPDGVFLPVGRYLKMMWSLQCKDFF